METEVSTITNWVVAVIAALVLWSSILQIIEAHKAKSQKRILTSIALANGIILEIGISPMGMVASELVPLSPLLSMEFSGLVYSLVSAGTVVELTTGAAKMYGGSGWFGLIAFGCAFIGGSLLPYENTMAAGGFIIVLSFLLMEAAPTSHWWTQR